jgi:hypothetical protein
MVQRGTTDSRVGVPKGEAGDHARGAIGYGSGWTVEEDPKGSFRWTAHGPRGTLRGQAATRAEAEQAAQQAE